MSNKESICTCMLQYTEKQANNLGVRGWCINTATNTVKGELEAPLGPLNEMQVVLKILCSVKSMYPTVIID